MAGSSVIGSLRVDLGLDSAKFETGSKKVKAQSSAMQAGFASLAKSLAAPIAAMASIAGVAALVGRGAADIDKVAKAARRLETSVTGFRAFELAAGEAGVALESLVDAVQTMDREIAKGSKGAANSLKALGLSAKDLGGLEADEKLALIADKIQEMGLSTGQASVVLQEFGIRNKEMVLAVMNGGDVFRSARADIVDYGLGLSSIQTDKIEAANDAIGRLSLIGQYLAQELSLAVTPALGAMAQAMTDSLREGGLLRGMIDGLVGAVGGAVDIFSAVANIIASLGSAMAGAAKWVWDATGGFFGLGDAIDQAWSGLSAVMGWAYDLIIGFSDLIDAAGSFGGAMEMLGGVAAAVWQGIVDSAAAIPPALDGVWQLMQGGFLLALSAMATKFHDFIWTIANGFNGVEGMEAIGASLMAVAKGADEVSGSLSEAGNDAKSAASGSFKAASDTIAASFGPAREAVQKLSDAVAANKAATEGGTKAATTYNAAVSDLGDGSGGGKAGKAAKEAEKLAKEIEKLEFDADPLKKYNAELANLDMLLANGLSIDAYQHALADLNEELANSSPLFGDIVGGMESVVDYALDGFKDGFSGLLDIVKNTLKSIAAAFLKQKFVVPITAAFSSSGSLASAATGGAGGMGGVGGSTGLLGSIGGIGSAFMAGMGDVAFGVMNGGLAGGFSTLTTALGGATSGVAGLATAAGALALPLLAVGAVFSFFKTKTTQLGNGMRITATDMDTLAESFNTVKKTKYWGLSSKVSTTYSDLDASNPIYAAVDAIRDSGKAMGEVLGLTAENFSSFAASMEFSLKDMSEEQAMAEIQRRLGILSDQFMYAALGSFEESLGGVIRDGETATEAMTGLATSLQAVNYIFTDFGVSLLEASIPAAMAARDFTDALGGVESAMSKTSAYFTRYYSATEQSAAMTDRMRTALADLGLVLPSTIEGFRALVDQALAMGDLTKAAQLIDLSSGFAAMIDGRDTAMATATQDLQDAFAREMEATRAAFEASIAALQDSLTGARETLANSKAIATALESALNKRIFPSIDAQRRSQDQAADYLRSLLGLSRINDVDALNEALGAVASPSADTYETLEDYRRDFARTSGVIAALKGTADIALGADEQAVLLLEQQLADMESQFDAEMTMLQAQLDAMLGIQSSMLSLADAISAFMGAKDALGTANLTGAAGIEQIYTDVLGRAADAAGLAFYSGLFAGGLSLDAIRADIAGSSEALTGVMPSFDGGGWTGAGSRSGGLDGKGGFAAMLHPNETVIDHTRGGAGSADMIAELRGLRAEVAQLNASNLSIARSTNSSAATSRKWDEIGLPGTADGEIVKTEAA